MYIIIKFKKLPQIKLTSLLEIIKEVKSGTTIQYSEETIVDYEPSKFIYKLNNKLYLNGSVRVYSTILYSVAVFILFNPRKFENYTIRPLNERLIENIVNICKTKLLTKEIFMKKYLEVSNVIINTINKVYFESTTNIQLETLLYKSVISFNSAFSKSKCSKTISEAFLYSLSTRNYNFSKTNLKSLARHRSNLLGLVKDDRFTSEKIIRNKLYLGEEIRQFIYKKQNLKNVNKLKLLKLSNSVNNKKSTFTSFNEKPNFSFNDRKSILERNNTQFNINNQKYNKSSREINLNNKLELQNEERTYNKFNSHQKLKTHEFQNVPFYDFTVISKGNQSHTQPNNSETNSTLSSSLNIAKHYREVKSFDLKDKDGLDTLLGSIDSTSIETDSKLVDYGNNRVNVNINDMLSSLNLNGRRLTNSAEFDLPNEESILNVTSSNQWVKTQNSDTHKFGLSYDFSNLYHPVLNSRIEDSFDPVTIDNNLRGCIIEKSQIKYVKGKFVKMELKGIVSLQLRSDFKIQVKNYLIKNKIINLKMIHEKWTDQKIFQKQFNRSLIESIHHDPSYFRVFCKNLNESINLIQYSFDLSLVDSVLDFKMKKDFYNTDNKYKLELHFTVNPKVKNKIKESDLNIVINITKREQYKIYKLSMKEYKLNEDASQISFNIKKFVGAKDGFGIGLIFTTDCKNLVDNIQIKEIYIDYLSSNLSVDMSYLDPFKRTSRLLTSKKCILEKAYFI